MDALMPPDRRFMPSGRDPPSRAAALTCVEERELENIFALLLLGSFVGLPAPPTFLAVELLPFMQKEIQILSRRAEDASDMLAVLMGSLGVDG